MALLGFADHHICGYHVIYMINLHNVRQFLVCICSCKNDLCLTCNLSVICMIHANMLFQHAHRSSPASLSWLLLRGIMLLEIYILLLLLATFIWARLLLLLRHRLIVQLCLL